MSLQKTIVRSALILGLAAGGCGDDKDTESPRADAGAGQDQDGGVDSPLYVIGSSVQTQDESTLLVWTTDELSDKDLALDRANEMSGGTGVFTIGDYVYVASADASISRYTITDGELEFDKKVSFANRGFNTYFSYTYTYLDEERAFVVNGAQLQIVEWNPTTMTITDTYDIGDLKREGWGHEYRGGFVRKSDGKLFILWTYTNDRVEFDNKFVLGVFDTKTGELTIEEDAECPASAGFGGFFDENEDLYLLADSFGGFTRFGGFDDVKDECMLRVKHDEDRLDPDYRIKVPELLDGRSPWGFYYAGDGKVFTSGIDPKAFDEYPSVFELLFAPIHTGWLIELSGEGAREVEDLPADGVGFASHNVDGTLYVPRTTGKVEIEEIESLESTLFRINTDATAEAVLSLPGYIDPVLRAR